jgi:type III secretion system YopN/LcrE/InvE/MxiC family regulator
MVEIRSTPEVAHRDLAREAREDAMEGVQGYREGELVVPEKEPVQLAEEMCSELGELFQEEIEAELGRHERRVSRNEETIAEVVMEDGLDEKAQELPDLLARKDEIEALGREMKELGLTDPDDILEYIRQNLGEQKGERGPNGDPLQQYGALAIIEKMFADEDDEEMAGAMGSAAIKLLGEHPTEIHKGLIVSEAAALYASEKVGSISDLRALYMGQVVAHQGIPASFNAIMEKHGEAGFKEAVAFLIRAAGDDLATMTGNNDRIQQKEVLDNLYQLEVLNTMRERTEELLERIGRSFPLASAATAQKVMRDTFGMIENQVRMAETTVTRLARETVPDSIEGRISFLREFRTLAALIPVKVFDEADKGGSGGLRLRERLSDAIIDAQDVADAEEQEKLNAQ